MFRTFAVVVLLSVVAAGAPSFLLSFERHNFIPAVDFHSQAVLSHPRYAVLTLALLIAALATFLLVMYEETRYLVPSHALSFFRKAANGPDGRQYLQSRYASPPDYLGPLLARISERRASNGAAPLSPGNSDAQGGEPEAEDEETMAQQLARHEASYEADMRQYEIDRKRWERLDNPYAPIEYYIVQAVQKGDLPVLLTALKTFEGLIADSADDKEHQSHLVRYYSEVLRHSTDIGLQSSLSSPTRYIVDSARGVYASLVNAGRLRTAHAVAQYLRDTADRCMGKMPSVFIEIMAAYREIAHDLILTARLNGKASRRYFRMSADTSAGLVSAC